MAQTENSPCNCIRVKSQLENGNVTHRIGGIEAHLDRL